MAENLVRDLVHRRVPQILGINLGIAWGVTKFLGMRVDHYLLSPHPIDRSTLLLGLANLRLQKDSIAPLPSPFRRGRWRI